MEDCASRSFLPEWTFADRRRRAACHAPRVEQQSFCSGQVAAGREVLVGKEDLLKSVSAAEPFFPMLPADNTRSPRYADGPLFSQFARDIRMSDKTPPRYPPIPEPLPTATSAKPDRPRSRKTSSKVARPIGKRLVSLDAYRGFIMMMLAATGFGVASFAKLDANNPVWKSWDYEWFQSISYHFGHPPWESIRGWMTVSFWDMIQPSFMFMVGVAMPFSYARRSTMGSSARRRLLHAIVRAIILVLMGVFLSSFGDAQTDWVFANVLCQIGLGYVFAYLMLGWTPQMQVGAIAMILFGYWGWFMLNPPPADFDYDAVNASAEKGEVFEGRYAPWSKNANAAHFFDVAFLNMLRSPEPEVQADEAPGESPVADAETDDDNAEEAPTDVTEPGLIRKWFFSNPKPFRFNGGGYATLNFIPSIATTLLGILCGQLLLSPEKNGRKLLTLLIMGAACLGLGILAHHTVCPIVKRIWTPSWVLFAGGYTIWMLGIFYLVFDVLPFKKLAFPLVVVGMNSIAMYMMGQMLRPWVRDRVVTTHFGGILKTLFGPDALSTSGVGALVLPTATFAIFWLIAFWMYRNRYFLRV